MQKEQAKMLDSLHAIDTFFDENGVKLAAVIASGARQQLKAATDDLSADASDQTGNSLAAKGATQKQQVLRQTLVRDHIAPIVTIAKADLPPTPDVQVFRMPNRNTSPQKLASAAHGMAKVAAPFAATFIAAGLPEDFVAQTTAAADALLDSVAERAQIRGRRAAATSNLKTRLSKARKTVRVLDAFIKSALKDDPGLLQSWNSVKRVSKTTGRSAPAPAPAPAPVATHATDPAPAPARPPVAA